MTHGPPDDDALIAGFLAGEAQAHAVLDDWITRVVHHRAWRLRADTEDLVQDVKYRLVRTLGENGFQGRSSLKTFAQSVAKNACLDALRRARIRTTEELSEEPPAPSNVDPGEAMDSRAGVRLAFEVLQRLPAPCRDLLRRILELEQDYESIAAELGVARGTVKSRAARCRDQAVRLRTRLEGGRARHGRE
ncbi:MAG: hypothetical protein DHS20C21_23090 [Gemmatimonadota bacterium]|nr:MAG: hypothetical protein DHS20C21_23090 [Gemmatimonadota bacterium]